MNGKQRTSKQVEHVEMAARRKFKNILCDMNSNNGHRHHVLRYILQHLPINFGPFAAIAISSPRPE
jgi:hypothetical protein